MSAVALGVQGSGWGALAWKPVGKRLLLLQIYDHQGNLGSGSVPLLVLEMWGACLVPAVQEREGQVGQELLGHRRLERRVRALP
jgi:hypothetical protein